MSAKSIAVIGGGIGGVSAALNLLRAGIDVHVYEQSRTLREVGAGINVTPNAVRVIHGLGLGDKLASLGVHLILEPHDGRCYGAAARILHSIVAGVNRWSAPCRS